MPRPKNPNTRTGAQRMADSRAHRPKRREVILSPEADSKAERLMAERQVTFVRLVDALIAEA